VKANTVADAELQHLGMRAHLLQVTKPLDNPFRSTSSASLSLSMSIFVTSFSTFELEDVVIGGESSYEWTIDEDRFRPHIHLDIRCFE
jgi:hypothetical protein